MTTNETSIHTSAGSSTGKSPSVDDARKKRQTKRDCAEVVDQEASYEDVLVNEAKKLRKEAAVTSITSGPSATIMSTRDIAADPRNLRLKKADEVVTSAVEADNQVNTTRSSSKKNCASNGSQPRAQGTQPPAISEKEQDLESSLQFVVGIDERQIERISNNFWISFRLGHNGDASTIASFYQKTNEGKPGDMKDAVNSGGSENPQKNVRQAALPFEELSKKGWGEDEEDCTTCTNKGRVLTEAPQNHENTAAKEQEADALELWLADGLGNEDTPPSLYSLMAHIHFDDADKSSSLLASVAMLTLAWEMSSRVLRVEWLHVDSDLDSSGVILRRMWLRLSALSLMAGCKVVNDTTNTT